MPAERAPMRNVREVLRLKHACGVSERQIAKAVGISNRLHRLACIKKRCNSAR